MINRNQPIQLPFSDLTGAHESIQGEGFGKTFQAPRLDNLDLLTSDALCPPLSRRPGLSCQAMELKPRTSQANWTGENQALSSSRNLLASRSSGLVLFATSSILARYFRALTYSACLANRTNGSQPEEEADGGEESSPEPPKIEEEEEEEEEEAPRSAQDPRNPAAQATRPASL